MAERILSRRDFITWGATIALWAAITGCEPLAPEFVLPARVLPERPENPLATLGSPEVVDLSPLVELPDIQTPFFKDREGKQRGFVTAGQRCYPVAVNSESGKLELTSSQSVIGPDRTKKYRNGYTGISSVVQPNPDNPDLLVGALDCEEHAVDPYGQLRWWEFRGRVVLGVSRDGGATWEDRGVFIQGHDPLDPGVKAPKANNEVRPTGAIQPWMILETINGRKYVYTYYTDLTSDIKRPNQICLSRSLINNEGDLGPQQLLTRDQGFVENGEELKLEPKQIFPIPENGIYNAYPSVYTLGAQKIGLFESEWGFYMAKSFDGIEWSTPQQIIKFPNGINRTKNEVGGPWFSSPSVYSPGMTNNNLGKSGYLLYSDGVAAVSPGQQAVLHQMRRMSVEFK